MSSPVGDGRIEVEEGLNLILVDLPMDLGAVCGFGCRGCRSFGFRLLEKGNTAVL